MANQNRTTLTRQQLHVAEHWYNGVCRFTAWWTFSPGRVGHGATRMEAIKNIPRRKPESR